MKKRAPSPTSAAPPSGHRDPAGKRTGATAADEIRVARAEFAAGAARLDQLPPTAAFADAPEIAFAGRSNVGKSSLLNMLLARRGLARTSNTPGRTRQVNFFDVVLARAAAFGDAERPRRLVFVDLPGYGYAKVAKSETSAWKELLEGYLHRRTTLRMVVVLVDVRRGLEAEEEDLVGFLAARPGLAIVVAGTKVDKLPRSAQKPALDRLVAAARRLGAASATVVGTSAETGFGRERLWSLVLGAAALGNAAANDAENGTSTGRDRTVPDR